MCVYFVLNLKLRIKGFYLNEFICKLLLFSFSTVIILGVKLYLYNFSAVVKIK